MGICLRIIYYNPQYNITLYITLRISRTKPKTSLFTTTKKPDTKNKPQGNHISPMQNIKGKHGKTT